LGNVGGGDSFLGIKVPMHHNGTYLSSAAAATVFGRTNDSNQADEGAGRAVLPGPRIWREMAA
jgi:hypothetical protein